MSLVNTNCHLLPLPSFFLTVLLPNLYRFLSCRETRACMSSEPSVCVSLCALLSGYRPDWIVTCHSCPSIN